MYKLAAVLLVCFLSSANAADSLVCVQNPKRVKACPHLVYRLAQLPDMPKPAVICICVSDFNELLIIPKTEQEQMRLNMNKRQMQVVYGNKLEPVLNILQRRN
ncbi:MULTISPECIES: hypothetical protein [Rheinheimera]|uniref:hypothetical protein n=1 Tax=Rheinheimera TaxID=67575 RepID=UPI0010455E84|nr:hypothetical protein [Rheinheimera sp. D18]QBL10001.1 hypothetical protein E0Z06_10960 [Rheinheimera sp. D18]